MGTRKSFSSLRRLAVTTLIAAFCIGCSIRAEPLRSQAITYDRSIDASKQSDKKFLLKPFEDLRGGEYGYIYPTSFIPLVNFFHLGAYYSYPEQANILQADRGGRPTVTVGALDSAMPFLMAELMRKMRLTNNATPLEEVNTKVDLRGFDYVITGALKKTRFAEHVVLTPLGYLGILGVPFAFAYYDLDYEVVVAPAQNPAEPILRKTYTFSDSRVIGFYYNQSAAFDMFIGGLERTLPTVVEDIATIVAAQPPPPPAPPPAAPPPPTKPMFRKSGRKI